MSVPMSGRWSGCRDVEVRIGGCGTAIGLRPCTFFIQGRRDRSVVVPGPPDRFRRRVLPCMALSAGGRGAHRRAPLLSRVAWSCAPFFTNHKGAQMGRSSERLKARRDIVHRANLWIAIHDGRLLGMRQLQRAVCVCRRQRLVHPLTIAMAGFNPNGGRR